MINRNSKNLTISSVNPATRKPLTRERITTEEIISLSGARAIDRPSQLINNKSIVERSGAKSPSTGGTAAFFISIGSESSGAGDHFPAFAFSSAAFPLGLTRVRQRIRAIMYIIMVNIKTF